MNNNKIVIGILSVILLTPLVSFAGYDFIVPEVSPPSGASSHRLCWDSKTGQQYYSEYGKPCLKDPLVTTSSKAPLIITEKITIAKFKEVIGGAYGQLVKLATSVVDWYGNTFNKKR